MVWALHLLKQANSLLRVVVAEGEEERNYERREIDKKQAASEWIVNGTQEAQQQQ